MRKKLLDIWENEKLQSFLKENKEILIKVAASALLVVAAFFVFVASGNNKEESLAKEQEIISEPEPVKTMIMVDIGGEVVSPMVVELEEGSRVEDAIKAAGGVTGNADLTEINRADFLEDGDKILIPSKQETTTDSLSKGGGYSLYSDSRININTAGSEELQMLDGVGPATAQKIIDYRETNGSFKNIEDIKNVSGIGDKTYDKFKDDIRT